MTDITETDWGSVVDAPLFQCPRCGAPTDDLGAALMHCLSAGGRS